MQNNLPNNTDFIHKLELTIFISSKKVSVIFYLAAQVVSNTYAVYFSVKIK